MVRAKFKVESVGPNGYAHEVKLTPVTTGSEENESFFAATPGGSIVMSVVKEDTANLFEVGKEYYVDFTPVE